MARKNRQTVKLNDVKSMESVLQEVYDDSCSQINDAQRAINELVVSATPEDVDDLAKIAKERGNLLKIKDYAIKTKLEVAKLQNEVVKHSGNVQEAVTEVSGGKVSQSDFQAIREMIMNKNKE